MRAAIGDAVARSLIEVPEPRETAAVELPDGAEIVVRRHGRRDGPRLLLSHGNGFAADMYYPMWGRLAEDFDIVLFDLRNHGWNAVGDISKHNLPQFAADIDFVTAEVGRCFGEKRTLGVFHSVSALAVCVSHSRGKHYAGLFLLDPPFCRPGKTYAEFDEATQKAAAATRRRQFRFRSFAESLPLHRLFLHRCAIPGAADLMARTILREADDGEGVVLRCPREYEALIVEYATPFAVLVDFDALSCPVKVLGADPTLPYSFLPTFNLAAMTSCDYDFVPEASHMLFVERPDFCAARIREFAGECGLLDS